VYEGFEVPLYYDPLLSKLSAWGRDRDEAIGRMRRALSEYVVEGIKTNIPFHQRVLRHPDFLAGEFDTTFIDDRFLTADREPACPDADRALIAAAVLAYVEEEAAALRTVGAPGDLGGGGSVAWRKAGRRAAVERWG
jgi:acetyl-CoA carboxylase biotin carboxylase subunit